MDFDEELELVFTRTEMICSFYQDSILGHYNDLKNRLPKTNRWDQRVEISPLSQIYTHKLQQYKDWWTKEEWEKNIKNYYRNNTDGDWIFEYQATYEKSFYVTKKEKAKFKPGDEYYYEKELIQELRREENGGEFYGFWDDHEDSPHKGASIKNFPKEPQDKIQSDLEYRVKYKKWSIENNIGIETNYDWVIPWTASGEDYWRLDFEENYDNVHITQEDINDFQQIIKDRNQKYVDEQEERIKKARESWDQHE